MAVAFVFVFELENQICIEILPQGQDSREKNKIVKLPLLDANIRRKNQVNKDNSIRRQPPKYDLKIKLENRGKPQF